MTYSILYKTFEEREADSGQYQQYCATRTKDCATEAEARAFIDNLKGHDVFRVELAEVDNNGIRKNMRL